jgi:diamine N-acetyltransferase
MLKGKYIQLRATEPADIDLLMIWENNPGFWTVSQTLVPFSRNHMAAYIKNSHQPIHVAGQFRLIMEQLETGKAIGTLDLYDYDAFHQRCGIGILIASAQDRGKGLAREAVRMALNYCFEILLLQQVYCQVLANNAKSLALFYRSGFQHTGTRKRWIKTANGFQDEFFLQCFRPGS